MAATTELDRVLLEALAGKAKAVGLFSGPRELSKASYRRQDVTLFVRGGSAANLDELTFPVAGEDWGLVDGFALYTDASAPEPLTRTFPLEPARKILALDRLRIPKERLRIRFVERA